MAIITPERGVVVFGRTPGGVYVPVQAATNGSLYVGFDASLPLNTVGSLVQLDSEIIRTGANNTPYTINQRVGEAGAITAPKEIPNAVRLAGGTAYIIGMSLSTDLKSITPRMRIHFYRSAAVTLAADGANWKEIHADLPYQAGWYDLPAMSTALDTANSDCSRAQDRSMRYGIKLTTTSLYYALETIDACNSAASQKFNLSLLLDWN